jgi:transposase
MIKATRARYTLEFKQEGVRLVESGQSIAAASRRLGVVEQTLFNWVKAQADQAATANTGYGKAGKQSALSNFPHSHDDYEL